MTVALELITRLLARGATLEPDGGTLVIRPASAVRPDEIEALKQNKAQVLALLSVPSRLWVDLQPAAMREALGPDPADHDVAMLRFDVVVALRQLEAEIISGNIGARPVLVRSRPLGDWLSLDDVARLLRLWTERPPV